MSETTSTTDPRTWWLQTLLVTYNDVADYLQTAGNSGSTDAASQIETAIGRLAVRGYGFHLDNRTPSGGTVAIQASDPRHAAEHLILEADREGGRTRWTLEIQAPRARHRDEYPETRGNRQLADATAFAAVKVADALLKTIDDGYANWTLCRNTSLVFNHPSEIERAARHVRKATKVIDAWSERRDKPSVLELAEKLSPDAELSLRFLANDEHALGEVRLMVGINERHALSIDRLATRKVRRRLGIKATTSWTAEHASFYITASRDHAAQAADLASATHLRPATDASGAIVLAYLDAQEETRGYADELANALWAIAAHPSTASEDAIRAAFAEEEAQRSRITLCESDPAD